MQKGRYKTCPIKTNDLNLSRVSRRFSVDADELALLAFILKFNKALDQGEQRIVFAAAHVFAWLPFCASLASQNIAAKNVLAAKFLKSEPLRM
jgi:hypothetical protein